MTASPGHPARRRRAPRGGPRSRAPRRPTRHCPGRSTRSGRRTSPPTTAPAPPTTTAPCEPRASFAPGARRARRSAIRADSAMAAIRDATLVVGVDQGTQDGGIAIRVGEIRGFDVELLKRIATRVFRRRPCAPRVQDPHHAERITTVKSHGRRHGRQSAHGDVRALAGRGFLHDLLPGAAKTCSCTRTRRSTHVDLAGKTVCATRGSTSIAHIARLVPDAELYPVRRARRRLPRRAPGRHGRRHHERRHDPASFQAPGAVPRTRQDSDLAPSTTEPEPYAIAVSREHEDLVRFVNRVLQEMRDDGSLPPAVRRLAPDRRIHPSSPKRAIGDRHGPRGHRP